MIHDFNPHLQTVGDSIQEAWGGFGESTLWNCCQKLLVINQIRNLLPGGFFGRDADFCRRSLCLGFSPLRWAFDQNSSLSAKNRGSLGRTGRQAFFPGARKQQQWCFHLTGVWICNLAKTEDPSCSRTSRDSRQAHPDFSYLGSTFGSDQLLKAFAAQGFDSTRQKREVLLSRKVLEEGLVSHLGCWQRQLNVAPTECLILRNTAFYGPSLRNSIYSPVRVVEYCASECRRASAR